MADKSPVTINRTQRILAYMLASALGLSVIAMLTSLIARAVGVESLGEGFWPVVVLLPSIGLPLSFVLLLALIIISAVRRSRAANATE